MNENTVERRTALTEQSASKQSEKMFETARMEDLAVLDKRLSQILNTRKPKISALGIFMKSSEKTTSRTLRFGSP